MTHRRVVPLISLLTFLVAAETSIRLFAQRLPDPLVWNSYEVQNKAEQMHRSDIVVLGSSSMNTAVDPLLLRRLAGSTAYNASLNGADMRTIELWLDHVVLPRGRPKVVVVGTTSLELNDNGLTQRDFFRRFRASDAARDFLGPPSWTENVASWLEERSFLVRYRDQLRRPAQLFDDEAARAGAIDAAGRLRALHEYQSRPYELNPAFARRTRDESYFRFTVGGPQLAALERIAKRLRKEGVRFVLVKLPVTDDLARLADRAGERAYARVLSRFVSEHDPTFVDAAARLRDTRLFVDPLHLNRAGARRLTELLAGYAAVG